MSETEHLVSQEEKRYTKEDFQRVVETTRKKDGLPNILFYRNFSILITKLVSRTNLTPNQLTVFCLLGNILAAYFLFYRNMLPFLVVGIIMLQVARILDSVDGEIALLKNKCSKFGAWLDGTIDRISEAMILSSLALGTYFIYGNMDIILIFILYYLLSFIGTYAMLFSETLFQKHTRENVSGFIANIAERFKIKPNYLSWEGSLYTVLLTIFILLNRIDILFIILIAISLSEIFVVFRTVWKRRSYTEEVE
ncbi:MAG: CDP-alcohol phosphatidyltransferase family protein [Candidatus Aenigmarchaeota archaeon]|nr:CDP-alcohol phosphatidyltransferase family protein [Candidatus Aenigmarchaeota archaeon]